MGQTVSSDFSTGTCFVCLKECKYVASMLAKGGNRLFTAGVCKKKKNKSQISDKPSESQTDERIYFFLDAGPKSACFSPQSERHIG